MVNSRTDNEENMLSECHKYQRIFKISQNIFFCYGELWQ